MFEYSHLFMLDPAKPALILAPMQGIIDAPMRALLSESGAFTFGVSEYIRVSVDPVPAKVFLRDVPELNTDSKTPNGMPVQVQLLGGEPNCVADAAKTACELGAQAIDLNFGCPAKTVNRREGGAILLKDPARIREIVKAVRESVPQPIPISVKLRLGWESVDEIHLNARMCVEAGASWLTIHARTKTQGYAPPAIWHKIAEVRREVKIPVVANGDIWTVDDFLRCRDVTGCDHFMIGRGALANPNLSVQIAKELGLPGREIDLNWLGLVNRLLQYGEMHGYRVTKGTVSHIKEWLRLASDRGMLTDFDEIKKATTIEELRYLLVR
jgi:tRNA-dihydrouridine synthase C